MIKLSELWLAIEGRVVELIHRTEARGCRVYNSATQTIAAGTNTALTFNTEVHDTDECWDSGSPTRFTAQRDGYYMAGGGFLLASGQITSGGIRLNCFTRVNGATYVGGGSDVNTVNGQDAVASCPGQGMFWLSTGDYVEIMAYNGFGTSKTVSAATATLQVNCYGWLKRVG